ncbi:hypothetical protein MMC20_003337 [Loxospora ochrophaea]|nr:hypothetical protein [Loxospora ochrophaea]
MLASPEFGSIPCKIWQVWFGNPNVTDSDLRNSWICQNQNCSYTLLSNHAADAFVRTHYARQPSVLQTFLSLRVPVFRSDFFRYLVLTAEGGVYSDTDTKALKPIDTWIPTEFKPRAKVAVGIEWDSLSDHPDDSLDSLDSLSMTFCQYTIMAAPKHPLLTAMLDRVVLNLRSLATKQNVSLSDLHPRDDDVGPTTGPHAWTRNVLDHMTKSSGMNVSFSDMSGMTAPKLFGDTLLLPINAFGTGQFHSNSFQGISPDALLHHDFRAGWRNWDRRWAS